MMDKMTIANIDTTMHVHAFTADTTGFMVGELIGDLRMRWRRSRSVGIEVRRLPGYRV